MEKIIVKEVKYRNKLIKNKTPHPITLIEKDKQIEIESDGAIRLKEINVKEEGLISEVLLVPEGDNINPPENEYWIVSLPVAMVIDNPNLIVIDKVVRDEKGRTIGCRGFKKVILGKEWYNKEVELN